VRLGGGIGSWCHSAEHHGQLATAGSRPCRWAGLKKHRLEAIGTAPCRRSALVVVAAGGGVPFAVRYSVDQSMLGMDSARGEPGEVSFEKLGLAQAAVALIAAEDVLDKQIDPLEGLAVLTLPVQIVIPRVFGEDDLHSASSSTVVVRVRP